MFTFTKATFLLRFRLPASYYTQIFDFSSTEFWCPVVGGCNMCGVPAPLTSQVKVLLALGFPLEDAPLIHLEKLP